MIELVISPVKGKAGRFLVEMPDGTPLGISRQPLLDGARWLARAGYAPETLMTVRAHDRPYASFVPAPLGKLAQLTIEDADNGTMRLRRWREFYGSVRARTHFPNQSDPD